MVTLVKASDVTGYVNSPYHTRQWQDTVRLAAHLYATHGDAFGVTLYEKLADNDLNALHASIEPHPGFVNYPTLLPSQGSTTESQVTADYSDGYGGTYAKGE